MQLVVIRCIDPILSGCRGALRRFGHIPGQHWLTGGIHQHPAIAGIHAVL